MSNEQTEPTTYTVRNDDTSFPACLTIVPTGMPLPDYVKSWYVRHNQTIADWQKAGVGAMNNLRPAERVVLDLCSAVNGWAGFRPDAAGDYVGGPCVLLPLLGAITSALDYETGRLDPGTISEWCNALAERFGWDLGNGCAMPGEQ